MGRPPGVWQLALLDALERTPVALVNYVVDEVAGGTGTHAQRVAARRAARALTEAGKVRALYAMVPAADGTRTVPQLAITRPESEYRTEAAPFGTPAWMRARWQPGEGPMPVSAIAAALGVSRSTLYRDRARTARERAEQDAADGPSA